MSSPPFGFSPWRRRASSVDSTRSQGRSHDDVESVLSSPAGQARAQPALSSSFSSTGHQPIRSFIHGSFREHLAPVDSALHARSVREDTAELATYQLADQHERRNPAFLTRPRSQSHRTTLSQESKPPSDPGGREDGGDAATVPGGGNSDTIVEVSEPPSPELVGTYLDAGHEGPSLIARALRKSPPENEVPPIHDLQGSDEDEDEDFEEPHEAPLRKQISKASSRRHVRDERHSDERTPLLGSSSGSGSGTPFDSHSHTNGSITDYDMESQKASGRHSFFGYLVAARKRAAGRTVKAVHVVRDPETWSPQRLWTNIFFPPIAALPAVLVGLLLNILDALSYGMILFPLGSPVFANLGSAGISIFYVSTIVSQLVFSCGSIFRGGIGSELIEVVPFFHSMAATITNAIGEDNPNAVIATTIVSYALSSMLTGLVFYLMGRFRFGYIVGFIPRHILIGCIGGVGWFLVATGFEVSARIDGSLNYDLDTLHKLTQADTIPLWLVPFALAIVLFWSQQRINNKYFLPLYILAIPCIFYFFVLSFDALEPNSLRKQGWIFDGPPADEPWWYFYTLYQFKLVHWEVILECIPAMLALTFFGLLHVPINVPALALQTGEDHADLNHELKLHGYSNFLSGAMGSIQNYLVYANTIMFMRSGGDSRLAGIELAALTFGVMTIGPKIIGFIPVMMVGCLIFDLGFELLLEAIWSPRKKLKMHEYLTVIVIVLIMGIYDFVVGIGVGVLLAFVAMIFQTSQVSAVRAAYSGEIVYSTVRRNPTQQHYLRQVGSQIHVMKLAGYLFFGTIVGVEAQIRRLIADEAFHHRPIRYLILDLQQVTGLDYSAGEAFNTISRLVDGKGIKLVLSGIDGETPLGQGLRAVGLGADGIEVLYLPNLNSALESCENELLKIFYASQEEIADNKVISTTTTPHLAVPGAESGTALATEPSTGASGSDVLVTPSLDLLGSSPRRSQLQIAARKSLNRMGGVSKINRWRNFGEPLRLMLQIFQDLSDRNEDFWYPAAQYFSRREYVRGTRLFGVGEPAGGFYLLERGIIRAEYDLPHGQHYHESIVAGTTCGELPFFSETSRTARAYAELDCVAWVLDPDSWRRLQRESPEVAQELLRIGLKLTAERMSTVPSSTMIMAQ